VSLTRLRDVALVVGGLAGGEVARAAGIGTRQRDPDPEARQRQRARAVRHALERLGPFYVKVGQMLSTRPDIVPEYMIAEFENLHEKVTATPFSTFEPVLEDELGRNWERHFKDIHTATPLGTASLAQVYRATLQSGEPAVVKIQRPGILRLMLDDMAMLRKGARLAAKRARDFNEVIDVESMLEVIFRAMEPELDFTVEADNMDEARDSAETFDTLAVPEVIFVTKRVLVQSLATGQSIRDVDRDRFAKEEQEASGRDLLAFMYRGFFVDRFFHADPHPGNIFVEPGEPAYLIDWGMVGRLDRRMSTAVVLIILNMAQADGVGAANAWVEMGRATSWANIPAFQADLAGFLPTIAGASLEKLNFGLSLTSVLKFATRRGIQTSPMISLLGKSFANIEGSVRYLAPEARIIDIFEDEFQDILFELVTEALSQDQAAKLVLETMIGAAAAPDQLRTLLRDFARRELTLNVTETRGRRTEAAADRRTKALQHTLLALAAAAWWREHRRSRGLSPRT
jgi:ubiquinone biosynthesis protein